MHERGVLPHYIYTQSDTFSPEFFRVLSEGEKLNYDCQRLKDLHVTRSMLHIDKYLWTSLPSGDLQLLFDSCGLSPSWYTADLCEGAEFWVKRCSSSEGISERLIPNVRGGKYNPFVRFSSSRTSASQQHKKLLDVVGMGFEGRLKKRCDGHVNVPSAPVILDFEFTYPLEISCLLMDVDRRDDILRRSDRCKTALFNRLDEIFDIPEGKTMGASVSTHVNGSDFPLPHLHHHFILPNWMYRDLKVSKKVNERLEVEHRPGVSSEYDRLYRYVSDELIVKKDVVNTCSESVSGAGRKSFVRHDTIEYVDRSPEKIDEYQRLRRHVERRLCDPLGYEVQEWMCTDAYLDAGVGIKRKWLPVDADLLKNLWTEVVLEEFGSELDGCGYGWRGEDPRRFDVHVSFCRLWETGRILHKLQYKNRPAVVDLDLFFRRCPDLIRGPCVGAINLDGLDGWLSSQLHRCSDREDLHGVEVAESRIRKLRYLRDLYGEDAFYQWFQWVAVGYKTRTSALGWWWNVKRYQVCSVERGPLPSLGGCPLCGGFEDWELQSATSSPVFDSVLLHHGSGYFFFDLMDRPPDPGGG